MTLPKPVLHRDDPQAEPLTGNIKVTRNDWLNLSMDVLISDGVERVKISVLATRIGVSRSSFYWYFESRQDLLDALLKRWDETNTAALVAQTKAPAETITGAVCNVFRCTANPELFNTALDFAVRDWARRSGPVRDLLDRSDSRRVEALDAMFRRYGFKEPDALTRARVLYYMQLGYDTAQMRESPDQRLAMVPHYLRVFTGNTPRQSEIDEFNAYARRYWTGATTGDDT